MCVHNKVKKPSLCQTHTHNTVAFVFILPLFTSLSCDCPVLRIACHYTPSIANVSGTQCERVWADLLLDIHLEDVAAHVLRLPLCGLLLQVEPPNTPGALGPSYVR